MRERASLQGVRSRPNDTIWPSRAEECERGARGRGGCWEQGVVVRDSACKYRFDSVRSRSGRDGWTVHGLLGPGVDARRADAAHARLFLSLRFLPFDMALTKQRQPAWTPDQLAYLTKRNHDVPRDLWLGVTALIFLFGAYSVSSRGLNRWRVRRYHSLHQPPTRVRRAGSTAVAFLPSAMLASWRKATYRRGQVVQWLGLGSAAQLVSARTGSCA